MSRTSHSAHDPAADRTKPGRLVPAATSAAAKARGRGSDAELRQTLATTLPDEFGLTLKQTADALGRSISWVAKARAQARSDSKRLLPKQPHGGRRNQILRADEEAAFMEDVCRVYIKIHKDWRANRVQGSAAYEATKVRFEERVRSLLQVRTGRPASRATAYNIMARVGRAKFSDYTPWKWHQYCEKKFFS